MKTKTLAFIAIFFSIAVFSQTIIPPGPISGTWTLAGSPYLVQGETFVLEEATLTIEPGVLVEWQGSYPMWIQGQILAQGTETDSITFTAANPINGWQGIRYDFSESDEDNVDTSRFEYCKFKYGKVYNATPNNAGGAIAVTDFSKIIIDHCLFTKNTAIVFNGDNPAGGAIALGSSSPVITNCLFTDNLSFSGGAIFCFDGSNPSIESNIFKDNTADGEEQYAQGYGGAIACWIDCDPMIRNNIFNNNYAETGGGAIAFVSRCNPSIIQNLFTDNTCDWIGGAIELQDTCNAQIINNTIANNFGYFGGGIHLWDGDTANITNTIIWGNHANDGSAGQIYIESGSLCVVNLYYSDLQGGWDGIGGDVTGDWEDCIDKIPVFVGSGSEFPFQINDISPCIDKGDPDTTGMNLPEFDLAGEIRIINDTVDIGAYEWNTFVGVDEFGVSGLESEVLCHPNPFPTSTTIEYELSQPSTIQLTIYDYLGKQVELIEEKQTQGKQQIVWNAEGLQAGVYFCVIKTNEGTQTAKLVKL